MHVGRTNFSKRIRLCCTLIRELRVLTSLKRLIFIWNKDRTNTRPWYLKIRILLQYQFQLHCGTHMKYLKLNSRTNNLRSSFFLSSKDLEGWSCSLTLEWHSNLDNYVCHSTRWVFIAGLFEYLCTEIPTSKQDCRNRGKGRGQIWSDLLTLFQPGGQIMPTISLLALPLDFETFLRPCRDSDVKVDEKVSP